MATVTWKQRADHLRTTISGPDPHPVDELPPVGRSIILGLQHMLAAYAGIIAPPLIIGTALHLPFIDITILITLSLFASGVCTLLQRECLELRVRGR